MVQLTCATSVAALVQLALLAQTSVSLPIEYGGILEPRVLARSDHSQLFRRDPTGTEEHKPKKVPPHKMLWRQAKSLYTQGKKKGDPSNSRTQGSEDKEETAQEKPGDAPVNPSAPTQDSGNKGSRWHRQYPDDPANSKPWNPVLLPRFRKRSMGNLGARDWDDLEKRYWDDLELGARSYNDLDGLQLSRRDDMELETREPYEKRSLGDLEGRDWDEFEKRYWLD